MVLESRLGKVEVEGNRWSSEKRLKEYVKLRPNQEIDENEVDELENVPAEMKTKSGYLKDGFVVEDNNTETANNTSSKDSSEEDDWEDDTSSEIELEFEEYIYSDED